MSSRKYSSPKHSVRSSTSELEKLEKTQKSELRMISTAAFKFRSKFIKVEDPRRWQGETEACNVRMYETHFPGFCYLKDGKYRRKIMSNFNVKTSDPVECAEKMKELLFTENELDVHKILCLHLLGTHVQNRKHIQRKDGRVCSYIKAPTQGNRRLTLQAVSLRANSYEKEIPSDYDKLLPRYVLDVRFMDRIFSSVSLHTYDIDNSSDDDSGKKRRLQVPIYINNDIRAIIGSVIEALETVNSPKLKEIVTLARNPDELRNLLSQEDIQEYMIELAGNQLVTRATAYDFVITHPVFDKLSDNGAVEPVAQVLDIVSESGLRNMLHIVRKTISRRYEELVLCNVIPGKKRGVSVPTGKGSTMLWNFSKTSFLSGDPSTKTCSSGVTAGFLGSDFRMKAFMDSSEKTKDDSFSQLELFNETKSERNFSYSSFMKGTKASKKMTSQSLRSIFPNFPTSDQNKILYTLEESSLAPSSIPDSKAELRMQALGRFQDGEITKYDLKNLSNSQRILLGLKVAGMKSKPVNMHQFESKKKVDMSEIISSIVCPSISDHNHSETLTEECLYSMCQKRTRRAVSRLGGHKVQGLGNLTRGVLSNFRHEIATSENKKRVKEFLKKQI